VLVENFQVQSGYLCSFFRPLFLVVAHFSTCNTATRMQNQCAKY